MAAIRALVGDIGGTHSRFAQTDGAGLFGFSTFKNASAAGLVEIMERYLAAESLSTRGLKLRLAVAAPITGPTINLTNLDWPISHRELSDAFEFNEIEFVNDFEAIAFAVPALGPDALVDLGGGPPADRAPVVVLGPGTGLGASIWVPHPGGNTVIATEAGHVTLAAATAAEAELIARVSRKFDHVSAERLVSGPGLVELYAALGRERPGLKPPRPPEIVAAAVAGEDAVAVAALDAFFGFLGLVAGNLALSTGARGGVYLGGGLLPRVQGALRASKFRRRFEAKGRFKSYLAAIPTRLIVHPEPALLGLATTLDQLSPMHAE